MLVFENLNRTHDREHFDCGEDTLNDSIPSIALVVDPLSPNLVPFYEKLGFVVFTKAPLRLMLPFPKKRF